MKYESRDEYNKRTKKHSWSCVCDCGHEGYDHLTGINIMHLFGGHPLDIKCKYCMCGGFKCVEFKDE